jgi:hypothetical protein
MKGYVDSKITANIAALVGGAPSTLDTLNELATALGSDANLSVTLTNSIANVSANVATLSSNAAVQSGNIAVLQSAVGSLTSNAAAQQTTISSLVSNAAVQAGSITNITNGTTTFTAINFVNGSRVVDTPTSALLIAPASGSAYVAAPSANANIVHGYTIQTTSANISVHNSTNSVTHHWQFADTGNLTIPVTGSIEGNVAFTMANSLNWTSNVYTVSDALNQLAERIKLLGG